MGLHHDDLPARAARARAAIALAAQAARDNPKVFASYVMRDERTGKPIHLAPMHRAWHDIISTNRRVVLWAHCESGKTSNISICRVLWEIGRDPSIRCAILSNTHGQAVKIVRSIGQYISNSQELRRVFPDMEPGAQWTSSAITVRRPVVSKDPSIQACGVHGNILGSRLDLVVIDDVLDFENARTADARKGLRDWLLATVWGRLTADARLIVVGTAYHPDDVMHQFAREWGPECAYRYPIIDENGEPRWPDRWPLDRIAARQKELGPLEFARQMLCVARDEATSRFKREWIDLALARGTGGAPRPWLQDHMMPTIPPGCRTYTGVDLAVQQHDAADQTVLFTILVHPNGDREVLECLAGRWSGPDIVSRIVDAHRRWQSVVVVENNAAQDFIVQFTRSMSAVPVRAFTTGRSKAHPEFGVESLAAEMASGKWIVPTLGGRPLPEVEAWVQELLYYDPRAHTGDRLMASWFAREGVRMGQMRSETGHLDLMSR